MSYFYRALPQPFCLSYARQALQNVFILEVMKAKTYWLLLCTPKSSKWCHIISASHSVYLVQIDHQVLHAVFFQVDSQRKCGAVPRPPQSRGLLLPLPLNVYSRDLSSFLFMSCFTWLPGSHGKIFPNAYSPHRYDPKPMESSADTPADIQCGPCAIYCNWEAIRAQCLVRNAAACPGNTEVT